MPSVELILIRSRGLPIEDEYHDLALRSRVPLRRIVFDMKTAGKAVNEMTDTAIHDSTSIQKNSHEKSYVPWNFCPPTRIADTMAMQMLRLRNTPKPSFCRVLIWTLHISRMGMLTTIARDER
jgi:hypothetical protein